MGYYAVQCRHCGRWKACIIKTTSYTYKCVYCRKTGKIKVKNEYGIRNNMIGPQTPKETTNIVIKKNEEKK